MGPRQAQRGVTLLETIIALGILGLIAGAFMTALGTGSRSTRTLDEQVQALALARSQLEDIKNAAFNTNVLCYLDPPPNCYPLTVTVPPQYIVTLKTEKIENLLEGLLMCDTAGDLNCLQKVTVSVSREGKPLLSLTTYKKR